MATDFTNPDWLPGEFAYDTPEDAFQRFRSQQPDFFQRQVGLGDWDRRMRARYMLGAPEQARATGADPSYFDYLTARSPSTGEPPRMQTYDDLLKQAQQAAYAGSTVAGPYLDPEGLTNDEWTRRAWLSSQFGTGEGAVANQIAVANLLALQRRRGAFEGTARGAYSGQMGQAIRQAMNTLYQQQRNVGAPKETFLDWYLGATGQAGTPYANATDATP